jgi:hypothetical protein
LTFKEVSPLKTNRQCEVYLLSLGFQNLSEDAVPEKMVDRKWSMVNGKFKILTAENVIELENTKEFKVRSSLSNY